jgi:sRNA-binding protein
MSLRERREAAVRAGLVIGALAEAFPRAFSVCARRRVLLALGIHRALLVAVQPAIIAGTFTAKDLKTALRRYVTSNGYLHAHLCAGAARVDPAGNVVGAVTPAKAKHAHERLERRRRKKPAAKQSGVNAGATTATSLAGFQPRAKENGHQLESVAAGAIQYENIYSEPPGRASPA